jgi:hypothetical protein
MLETGIFQLLVATPGINALISDRVFFVKMPVKETTLPAVVFNTIHSRSVWSARGPSGLRFSNLQFDSYATTSTGAREVSNELRATLENLITTLPDGTRVQGSIVTNDMDFPYEPGTSGYVFRRVLEIEFQHEE